MNGVGAESLVGQTVKGWLKRMKDGWGFMNSDAFSGDLFVHARENLEIANDVKALKRSFRRHKEGQLLCIKHAVPISIKIQPN